MSARLKTGLKAIRDVIYGCLSVPVALIGLCLITHHILVAKPRAEAKHARDLAEAGPIPFAGSGVRRPTTPVSSGLAKDFTDADADDGDATVPSRWPWKKHRKGEMKLARQSRSPLFSLPPEIRMLIWEFAIGGNEFCIDREPVRPQGRSNRPKAGHCTRHWDCSLEESFFCGSYCSLISINGGLLSLPLTCRQVYMETLPLLYQQNAITIHNHSRVKPSIPIWSSGRFDLLTELETTFMVADIINLDAYLSPPLFEDELDWIKAWRTIGSLPNLQSLTAYIQRVHWDFEIYVSQRADAWYASQEEFILKEPRKVTQPKKKWVLWLSWQDTNVDSDSEIEYPFEIMRRGPFVALRNQNASAD